MLNVVVAFVRTALAAALAAGSVEAAEVPPSAVLIITVDQGDGDVSYRGNPVLTTQPRPGTGPSRPARLD